MPRELSPCGSMAAARRHWRNGEDPCDACREAELEYQRAKRGSQPFRPAVCGTVGGYRRHLRETGQACADCKAANAKAAREYNAQRAARQAA